MNRNQALVEIAGLDGGGGLLLAFEPEPVDVLPRNAFERCNSVGADALMRLRMPGAQAKVASIHHHRPIATPSLHRHHLGATCDHKVLGARHDGGGRHVDAGDAGTAEAIERDAAGADVIAGVERRHPAEIAALRTALGTGAPDDVFDIGGIDPGAVGQRPQHGRAKLLRVNACQRALAGLADAPRRSACVDDPGLSHDASFRKIVARICRRRRFKVNSCGLCKIDVAASAAVGIVAITTFLSACG